MNYKIYKSNYQVNCNKKMNKFISKNQSYRIKKVR